MRVGICTDHGGFGLKEDLAAQLAARGTRSWISAPHALNSSDDYPDFVVPLAQAVAAGKVERGVAVCGSGVGTSVCTTKSQACARADQRPLLGRAGGRGRSHEHHLHGGQNHRPRRRLGPGTNLFGRQVQRRRAPSPARLGKVAALEAKRAAP